MKEEMEELRFCCNYLAEAFLLGYASMDKEGWVFKGTLPIVRLRKRWETSCPFCENELHKQAWFMK